MRAGEGPPCRCAGAGGGHAAEASRHAACRPSIRHGRRARTVAHPAPAAPGSGSRCGGTTACPPARAGGRAPFPAFSAAASAGRAERGGAGRRIRCPGDARGREPVGPPVRARAALAGERNPSASRGSPRAGAGRPPAAPGVGLLRAPPARGSLAGRSSGGSYGLRRGGQPSPAGHPGSGDRRSDRPSRRVAPWVSATAGPTRAEARCFARRDAPAAAEDGIRTDRRSRAQRRRPSPCPAGDASRWSGRVLARTARVRLRARRPPRRRRCPRDRRSGSPWVAGPRGPVRPERCTGTRAGPARTDVPAERDGDICRTRRREGDRSDGSEGLVALSGGPPTLFARPRAEGRCTASVPDGVRRIGPAAVSCRRSAPGAPRAGRWSGRR